MDIVDSSRSVPSNTMKNSGQRSGRRKGKKKKEKEKGTEWEKERSLRMQPVSTRPRMLGTTAKEARLLEVMTPETLDTRMEVLREPVL